MDIAPKINYFRLLRTIDHFTQMGYEYVEVPWLVSLEAIQATFPGNNNSCFQDKHVVGSGEQSFIQLMIEGKLPKGKYVTMTPCFRDEVELSPTRYLSFMKVELIDTTGDIAALFGMTEECKQWFEELQPNRVVEVRTAEGYDLELNGVEIGSYGNRFYERGMIDTPDYQQFSWVYGTALAEPRFGVVANK